MGTIAQKLQKAQQSKEAIKAALIAKGVANVDDVMSHYAGFIEAIQSGSSYDLPPYIEDGLKYAEEIQKTYKGDAYIEDLELVFFPKVKWGKREGRNMFNGCVNLQYIYPQEINLEGNCYGMFQSCEMLKKIPKLNSSDVTNFADAFVSCSNLLEIESIDISNAVYFAGTGLNNTHIVKLEIHNLGKSSMTEYDFNRVYFWGNESEAAKYGIVGARQSLVDSLLTYSYDRVSAGLPPVTLIFQSYQKNFLTEEEKQAITAKGYTLA